ncbi:MAG: 30S ribosomal protein S17 [Acidobacteriota bacterium]|nr:30S ribosomal protein S17 [Acidobacteriota bacterium]
MAETKTAGQVEKATKKANKNEKVGHVVANKMAKTIVVEVTRRVAHPLYKRIVSKRKKFYAHDEENQANVGDVVRIIECRPMSKLKRWKLGEIMRKAVQVTTDLSSIGIQPGREQRASVKKKKK